MKALKIGLAIAFLWSLAWPAVVSANHIAACSEGPPTNRWRGVEKTGVRHGASAGLEGQGLDQCAPPGFIELSGSFAFVNVEGSAFNDIVQIGKGRCRFTLFSSCNETMRIYWAWGRDSDTAGCAGFSDRAPTATLIQQDDGQAHVHKVFHTSNAWRVYLDGVQKASVGEASICWTPTSASWFGESFDAGDAIGGTSADHFRFTSTYYASSENGAFVATSLVDPCNYAGTNPPYYCDVINSTTFDIWTSR